MSSPMSVFSTRRVTMVDTQVRPSDVTKFPIIAAMLSVPREDFVPDACRETAYIGLNIDLGADGQPGRVVLEPRTLAKMLDALEISPDDRVLEIGTGLGYGAAVLAHMGASVVAVEADGGPAQARLAEAGFGAVKVVSATLAAGAEADGPFDVILIEGGVEEVPPALTAQLAEGGRIAAIFMQGALGTARLGRKQDGVINWRFSFNAAAPVLPGFARAAEFVL
jgi:protein-L-isoaspartate(D-aspartate) O-methyltransferase